MVSKQVLNNLEEDLGKTMSMNSRNLSLDFSSPYLLYDYVEDKKETINIDILVRSLASLMYHPTKAVNDLSLLIGSCVQNSFRVTIGFNQLMKTSLSIRTLILRLIKLSIKLSIK